MISGATVPIFAKKPGTGTPPQIEYIGYSTNSDQTITFEYRLTSGEPVLKQFELLSPCFTKDRIVSVSERYSLNPSKNRLRFTKKFSPGEVRIVQITLRSNYYQGISAGQIDYNLNWEPNKASGHITGPVPPSGSASFNNVSGQLGTLLSSGLALALVNGVKKTFNL
jgi:hypothetical protein